MAFTRDLRKRYSTHIFYSFSNNQKLLKSDIFADVRESNFLESISPAEAEAASVTIIPILLPLVLIIAAVVISDVPAMMRQAREHLFVNLNLLYILDGAKKGLNAFDDAPKTKPEVDENDGIVFDLMDDMEKASKVKDDPSSSGSDAAPTTSEEAV